MATSSSVSVSNGRPAMRCLSGRHPELHHDERPPILLVDFMNCACWDGSEQKRPLLHGESGPDLSIFGTWSGQKLQRNKAIELVSSALNTTPIPPAPELLDDAIVQDGLADHGETIVAGAFILRTGSRASPTCSQVWAKRPSSTLALTSNPETVPGQKVGLGKCVAR